MPNRPSEPRNSNIDHATVKGFGREWATYDQTKMSDEEHQRLFNEYFSIFPFHELPASAEGFDFGCGSGRWAVDVVSRVGLLHCIDASEEALDVAKRRLGKFPNVRFHLASSDALPLSDASQDFGYSIGVLHHIPDTAKALRDCVRKLKPGAPFLLYIYYKMENRPVWFRFLWRVTDMPRRVLSLLPFPLRKGVAMVVATIVYLPLARAAQFGKKIKIPVTNIPLSGYSESSFYSMQTDALDRFGTRLEQRFTRSEIADMMMNAGLGQISFREAVPYWTAIGVRRN